MEGQNVAHPEGGRNRVLGASATTVAPAKAGARRRRFQGPPAGGAEADW